MISGDGLYTARGCTLDRFHAKSWLLCLALIDFKRMNTTGIVTSQIVTEMETVISHQHSLGGATCMISGDGLYTARGRSEDRCEGKERRFRLSPYHFKKMKTTAIATSQIVTEMETVISH